MNMEINLEKPRTSILLGSQTTVRSPLWDNLRVLIMLVDRQWLVFVTRTGKGVPLCQLAKTFHRAGKFAHIPFKVSPHVLRASAVTFLKQQGFSDTDIMGVTGRASSVMIYAYDKSSRAENASRKVRLISWVLILRVKLILLSVDFIYGAFIAHFGAFMARLWYAYGVSSRAENASRNLEEHKTPIFLGLQSARLSLWKNCELCAKHVSGFT